MADKKFIKTFESHRESNKTEEVKPFYETVKQVDDIYKVGSINIPQSLINSYVKKVKDETQKNLRQLYSDMEIAEELVKYAVDTYLNSDDIPVSALLGGTEEESDDLGSEIEATSEEEIVVEEPATEDDEDIDDEDIDDEDIDDVDDDDDDEFEEPAATEDEDEDDELPI